MSGLLEAVSGFAQSGGLSSILSVAARGMEAGSSISASQREAEAIKSQGAQEQAQKEFEAQKLEREKKAGLSRQRALYAKAGVDISAGSPLEVMLDTAKEYQADIDQTRNIGNLIYQSALKSAKDVKTAGLWKGGATILTGASEFATSPLLKKTKKTSVNSLKMQGSTATGYIPGAWG